jgi:hypothetical protein
MKIPRGKTTEELPMKTPSDFATATKKAGFRTEVLSVETANDYASLIRLLGSLVRPFAVNILTIK